MIKTVFYLLLILVLPLRANLTEVEERYVLSRYKELLGAESILMRVIAEVEKEGINNLDEVLRGFLKRGFLKKDVSHEKLNFVNSDGDTALHVAVHCLQKSKKPQLYCEVISLLLSSGANPLIKDGKGFTPKDRLILASQTWRFRYNMDKKELTDEEQKEYLKSVPTFYDDAIKELEKYESKFIRKDENTSPNNKP